MIVDAFLSLLTYILTLVISIFPNGNGLPDEVMTASTVIGGYAHTFDALLPIDTLFTVLTLTISVQLAIGAFNALRWIVSYIPLIGGRGN